MVVSSCPEHCDWWASAGAKSSQPLWEEHKKKNQGKKTSASSGRWEQGTMCSLRSILWTCLLSKLASLSASTFLRRASSEAPWCFQAMPAKVHNDMFPRVPFTSSRGTNTDSFAELQSPRYLNHVFRFSLILNETVAMWKLRPQFLFKPSGALFFTRPGLACK